MMVVGQLRALGTHIGAVNLISTVIGLGVFAAMLVCERISARLPGALIALALATIAVPVFGLEARGVAVLGPLPAASSATAQLRARLGRDPAIAASGARAAA